MQLNCHLRRISLDIIKAPPGQRHTSTPEKLQADSSLILDHILSSQLRFSLIKKENLFYEYSLRKWRKLKNYVDFTCLVHANSVFVIYMIQCLVYIFNFLGKIREKILCWPCMTFYLFPLIYEL